MESQIIRTPATSVAIRIATILAACIVAVYFIYTLSQYIRFQALDNCSRIAKIENTINNGATKVYYPDTKLYQQCAERAGFN